MPDTQEGKNKKGTIVLGNRFWVNLSHIIYKKKNKSHFNTSVPLYFSLLPWYTLFHPMNLSDLLAADHLVAVEPLGQLSERGLDKATTQTQDQMESGLWNSSDNVSTRPTKHTLTSHQSVLVFWRWPGRWQKHLVENLSKRHQIQWKKNNQEYSNIQLQLW